MKTRVDYSETSVRSFQNARRYIPRRTNFHSPQYEHKVNTCLTPSQFCYFFTVILDWIQFTITINVRRILWYITTHKVPVNCLLIFNLVSLADCLRYTYDTKTAWKTDPKNDYEKLIKFIVIPRITRVMTYSPSCHIFWAEANEFFPPLAWNLNSFFDNGER